MGGLNSAMKSGLKALIREEARRLGFFKLGVVPAGPLPQPWRFARWLEAGMHGEMHYLERQAHKRMNPAVVLPDLRSILVLAMNYHTATPASRGSPAGVISRYAWGADYHRIVWERLRSLRDYICARVPGAVALHYVDTGPVMEKVWGAESGLAWMGKHSNLITRERGSWFFIGVILLNVEVEYDPPEDNYCGTCVRCLRACPTGAIVAPYVVDARLCISYLTIELRGSIPLPLRRLVGNRIFGCDDCQEVCPWNRFAVETPIDGFWRREGNPAYDLASLVSITSDEFRHMFAGTAIRRVGRNGFVRNVAVALGNSCPEGAVEALSGAMGDSSALVRAHAAWALGNIGSTEARCRLADARLVETDPSVSEEIDRALSAGDR